MKARLVSLLGVLALLLLAVPAEAQRRGQPGAGRPLRPATYRFAPDLVVSEAGLAFGAVEKDVPSTLTFDLENLGNARAALNEVAILPAGAGNGVAWSIEFDGQSYAGGEGATNYPMMRTIEPKEVVTVTVTFTPTLEQYDALDLRFRGDFDADDTIDTLFVDVSGLGGHSADPYLHVVIEAIDYVVDWDGNGSEEVTLEGTGSHTHEPGRSLTMFEWAEGASVLSTDPVTQQVFTVGPHTVDLTIYDDGLPQRDLTGSEEFVVITAGEIPGVLARYYDAAGVGASSLLNAVPTNADFAEVLSTPNLAAGAEVGSSEFTLDTMVRLTSDVNITTAGTYTFPVVGGSSHVIELDGAPVVGPLVLGVGTYELEVRVAVDDATVDLPIEVSLALDTGTPTAFQPEDLTHDQASMLPVLNEMPTLGIDSGGNMITIEGLGFFPSSGVTVHWGATDFTEVDFDSLDENTIAFYSPPGSGTIDVTVETPNGLSNVIQYQYSPTGPVPIRFLLALTEAVTEPTTGVWGPDRRLYVVTNTGHLHALTFDDTYSTVLSNTVYPGISSLTNHNALGIAVNPYDPPSPVKLYIGHGEHYLNGGGSFVGPSDYTGEVTILEGPNFDTPVPLITGLPTSNHDHAVNAIEFDNNGDMYIAVGGNTNAGVKHPLSGDLPESPFSAAILRAFTSRPGFNGVVTYTHSDTQLPSTDQVEGEMVDADPGIDIEVFSPGLRSSFDLVYSTKKWLLCTENGPNIGFGAASTGPSSETADPFDSDEINRLEYDVYYGSPHRGRGRYDARQYIYRGSLNNPEPSIPGEFRQMASWTPSSSGGIDEYRADTFLGQIRGQFIVQEYLDSTRRVTFDSTGRKSIAQAVISPFTGGLGAVTLPGGAIASVNYNDDSVQVLTVDDLSAVGLVVHDVFPWRAPSGGGYPFTIAGVGFGNLANTSVTIGGLSATLTRVSATRIEGTVPMNPSPSKELVDIVVTVDASSDTLEDAFRYLPAGPGLETGDWISLPNVPTQLGEVSAGVIGDKMYLVGEPNGITYVYDITNGWWLPNGASRPHIGHHHAAEVVDGKLYLIGGLDGGSEGKVQIYDPVLDSWSLGADMSWAGGSVNTCVIDGLIYVSGGIVTTFTVNNCAVYDPVLDSWTALAAMPDGRNHAAAGTDGEKFWIFGGRKGGNFVANGFDQVFVYDPVADTWESSDDVGSSLVPLPIGRGGTGKAIWYQDEFYVIGGETSNGPGATIDNVYDRVDVYDPATNTWRLDEPMKTPRHGIFPVLYESRIFLPGGGLQAGFGQSNVFDELNRQ